MKKNTTLFYVVLIILGIIFVVLSILINLIAMNSVYSGGAAGIGFAWIVYGGINLYYLNKRPDIIKLKEIGEKDERNITIREKAGYSTFVITLFTLVILEFALLILGYKLASILTVIVLMIHICTFLIGLKYYNDRI